MFYFKPVIRKILSDGEQVLEVEKIGNDKETLQHLISLGHDKESVMEVFEKHYGMEYVDLSRENIYYEDIENWNLNRFKDLLVFPYRLDSAASIQYFAINEIMNQKLRSDLAQQCRDRGLKAKFLFSFKYEIMDKHKEAESMFSEPATRLTLGDFDAEEWVNQTLMRAIDLRASDVHIETLERGLQVRYRVDGLLTEKKVYPYDPLTASTIMVRVKIISGMDISEKRKPQDGRLDNFKYNRGLYDFRVSSIKTIFGEKIVMRIFDKSSGMLSFEEIGFTQTDIKKIKRLLGSQNGIIYMAGATGSGKTTTLYTMIDEINHDSINIYTIEDPVEKTLKNVNQIQIDPLAGVDYANTLRALLRQDPDVIIVGEIRDSETADLSIRASLTGHLVMSTIHSNNAIDSISRLTDMKVEPYLLGASSLAFLSQRLVRKLCPYCKKKVDKLKKEEELWIKSHEKDLDIKFNESATIFEPVGCSECNNGYKGRLGIIEVLEMTDAVKDAIKDEGDSRQIRKVAMSEGFEPLIVNAFKTVESGTTSISEIMKQI